MVYKKNIVSPRKRKKHIVPDNDNKQHQKIPFVLFLVVFLVVLQMYNIPVSTEDGKLFTLNLPQLNTGGTVSQLHTGGSVAKQLWSTSTVTCPRKGDRRLQNSKLSQHGEDEQLLGWFNGRCNGTYIEMGALDGKRLSNTWVFAQEFDWKGLLIEVSPVRFEQLQKNRPNELATVNAAVCDRRRSVHYVDNHARYEGVQGVAADKGEASSGLWEFSTPAFRQTQWHGIDYSKLPVIPCLPLQDIIQENLPSSVRYFDIFSLDVEGGELAVLQSIDFNTIGFGIIMVESNRYDQLKNLAVKTFLLSHGYLFLFDFEASAFFANSQTDKIYREMYLTAEEK